MNPTYPLSLVSHITRTVKRVCGWHVEACRDGSIMLYRFDGDGLCLHATPLYEDQALPIQLSNHAGEVASFDARATWTGETDADTATWTRIVSLVIATIEAQWEIAS